MRRIFRLVIAIALLALVPAARADRIMAPAPPKPVLVTAQAEAVLIGKVIEIEKETVNASPGRGVPAQPKIPHKVAVIKIEDPLLGVSGLTQVRVGFPESALEAGGAKGNPPGVAAYLPFALRPGMEGVFFLNRHADGDFYVIPISWNPLLSKDANYAAQSVIVKKAVAAIDEPMAALKAKSKEDRQWAVFVLLHRYRTTSPASKVTEAPIPAEESQLLLQELAEISWLPEGGDTSKPSRSMLWRLVPTEKYGFKGPMIAPAVPGAPPADFNKPWDEATKKFLIENAGKIRLTRLAAGK